MAKILESAGYDALHIDAGCYESVYWPHPPIYMPHGFTVDITAKIKREVSIPVIAVGRLGIPALSDKVIREDKADMIALGRDLLADPMWPKKALSGHDDEIVPCIGCHECMNMAESGKFLTCAVNPYCGNEGLVRVEPAVNYKKVLIIGGGIAGMEAARISKIRGHKVILYEKSDHLGGHLIEASKPEALKGDTSILLKWYKKQIEKLNIEVHLNNEFNLELLKKENPDVIIVATESTCIIPKIPGINKTNVYTVKDLLLDKKKLDRKIIIIGGGLEGCECAIWLSDMGLEVTVVEQLDKVLNNMHRANRTMLLDLMENKNIDIRVNSEVIEIGENEVTIKTCGQNNKSVACDNVVIAAGLESENRIFGILLREGFQDLYNIGDCKKPRKIANAVWEAFMLAINI